MDLLTQKMKKLKKQMRLFYYVSRSDLSFNVRYKIVINYGIFLKKYFWLIIE